MALTTNEKVPVGTTDVYKELKNVYERMVSILQDPVLLELKTDMVSLECLHIISKASASQLPQKKCPQCRKQFVYSELKPNPVINQTAEELLNLQKILNLCDPTSNLPSNNSTKVENPIITINFPPPTIATPLIVPAWNPAKIDKTQNPNELFSKVIPVLRNLYLNADLIINNHDVFKKILIWTEGIPIYKNASYFSTYIYKHAYFVCIQKHQLQVVEDPDFGKNVILSNAVFPDYYSPILFRALCDWTLQEIIDLLSTNQLDATCIDRIKSTLEIFNTQQAANSEIKSFYDAIKSTLSPMYWNQTLTASGNFCAFLKSPNHQCSTKLSILGKLKTESLKIWEKKS